MAESSESPELGTSQENKLFSLDPLSGDSWDTLTAPHPRASFFHSSGWARVLKASYGHQLRYLGEMKGDKPRWLLPISEVKSPWKGRRGVSLPFSDECGPLCFNNSNGGDLLHCALEVGRRHGWKYFEIRGDIPDEYSLAPWTTYVGHEVDLTVGVDKLFEGLESSVRRAIRKAEKAGLVVRILDTLQATQIFYGLHCRTRRKHGAPPQPFFFFANLCEHVFQKGSGFILLAEHQGRAVASGVFVHHGRTGLYKFGASEEATLQLRANDLVMWKAIEWYATRGYTTFSMGRTSPSNEGLRRFKRGFGAQEKTINYFRYDLQREAFVARGGKEIASVSKLLKLTPVPVLRMIGRTLYRYLD